jgi:hypothetical protein
MPIGPSWPHPAGHGLSVLPMSVGDRLSLGHKGHGSPVLVGQESCWSTIRGRCSPSNPRTQPGAATTSCTPQMINGA